MIIRWYHDIRIQREMLGTAMLDTNPMDLSHIRDLIGLFAVGRLLGFTGPINRNHQFVFKFDYTPIPDDWNRALDFQESMWRTADDLWREAGLRKLAIFWSGGIDSTAALVALMQTNDRWPTLLRIYTSKSAIEQEYPWFYNRYLQAADVVVLREREFFDHALFHPDVLVTDGSCGDQLWGCNALQKFQSQWHLPYRQFYHSSEFLDKVGANYHSTVIDYIEQQISKFAIPTYTIANLYWMLTFTHKWDHVRLRHGARLRDIALFDCMHSFFDSFHLQRWCMANPDLRLGATWSSYKQPAKDFIYRFTKDSEYRDHKLQNESLKQAVSKPNLRPWFELVTDHGFRTRDQSDTLVSESFEWIRSNFVNP